MNSMLVILSLLITVLLAVSVVGLITHHVNNKVILRRGDFRLPKAPKGKPNR